MLRTAEFIRTAILEQKYLGFIGLIHSEIVCGAAVFIYALPPHITSGDRRQGHVLNFFTYPAHRRKGYARGLMNFLISAAKGKGLTHLYLHATSKGEGLYTQTGFGVPDGKAMVLKL